MKRVLITGAAGSVGTALTRDLLSEGVIVCALDNSEDALFNLKENIKAEGLKDNFRDFLGDIRDLSRIKLAMQGCTEVYHCAALKHVELCEYNSFEAIRTNIDGTSNIIQSSLEKNIEKVLITSSDKAVNPTSIMGATKLVAEKLFIAANNHTGKSKTRFGVVRFGNVWDTNGSVGRIFAHQIKNNQDLTVTDLGMTRFFITMKEAIKLCKDAMKEMVGGEIFTRSMGAVSIGEIAKAFLKYNLSCSIKIVGNKKGEKLYEELFTDVESSRTIYRDNTFITIPERFDLSLPVESEIEIKYGNSKKILSSLRSDSNDVELISADNFVSSLME